MSAMTDRPRAFILTGAFWVICRNPRYLSELVERGLRVLIITPEKFRAQADAFRAKGEGPAALIDDIGYVNGSLDREASFMPDVMATVMRWRRQYHIEGIYAVGETLVEPSGVVADAFDAPFPGLRATRVCRSKYLQRLYLDEMSPESLVIPPEERDAIDPAQLTYPSVVKPATRHSSSGVVVATDPEVMKTELAGYPDHETLLVEHCVSGPEYSVETLTQHGRPVFSSVTTKATTDTHSRTFVELSHTVGATNEITRVLRDADADVLRRLRFEDGITHSEWRVDDSRRPWLMEIAARTPGDGLLVLYELATGQPLEPQIVRVALGEPASYPQPHRVARQVYVEHPLGVLEDVQLDWSGVEPDWLGEGGLWPYLPPGNPEDPPALRAVFVQKEKGTRLEPLRSSDDRAVTFFIDAPTVEQLDTLHAEVLSALDIVVS
ncbi:ATP-grasp domain-containing protein [Haloechinothrix halophila]|uniref:ATP-grasp domain-containing protein n=1 Tax=Haloechinothrix halophila TaxID=1069073 RepID=UPI0003FC8BA4|nr:ATP-grasp domain-containing protein [Haloechinothrix halophila]